MFCVMYVYFQDNMNLAVDLVNNMKRVWNTMHIF